MPVDLRTVAQSAQRFFEAERTRHRLPFVHCYPKNSCEVTSAFLAEILSWSHPDVNIAVARAYNRETDEWHFWVEMNDMVIDITAQQFDGIDEPLVGYMPSPLEARFPDVDRLAPGQAMDRFPNIQEWTRAVVLRELASAIAA